MRFGLLPNCWNYKVPKPGRHCITPIIKNNGTPLITKMYFNSHHQLPAGGGGSVMGDDTVGALPWGGHSACLSTQETLGRAPTWVGWPAPLVVTYPTTTTCPRPPQGPAPHLSYTVSARTTVALVVAPTGIAGPPTMVSTTTTTTTLAHPPVSTNNPGLFTNIIPFPKDMLDS